MISKAIQMRQAKRLNQFFTTEFRSQKAVLDVYDRRVQARAPGGETLTVAGGGYR